MGRINLPPSDDGSRWERLAMTLPLLRREVLASWLYPGDPLPFTVRASVKWLPRARFCVVDAVFTHSGAKVRVVQRLERSAVPDHVQRMETNPLLALGNLMNQPWGATAYVYNGSMHPGSACRVKYDLAPRPLPHFLMLSTLFSSRRFPPPLKERHLPFWRRREAVQRGGETTKEWILRTLGDGIPFDVALLMR